MDFPKNLSQNWKLHGEKLIAACGLVGFMNRAGKRVDGRDIIKAIANQHERSNGLGGGFAGYGIYPDHAEQYAFHLMYLSAEARIRVEEFLREHFNVVASEEIPTRDHPRVKDAPLLWRYFAEVDQAKLNGEDEGDYVVRLSLDINDQIPGAFVASCGKNMGVFKGVGYPEDIGEFYRLEEYEGYMWLSHGRFPTNTQGWWGGCHPFNLLDWAVVHNGELSSYGINQRYLEMFGYRCTLMTDTEVVAYTIDLLMRKHKLPLKMVEGVIAAPLWDAIDRMPDEDRALYTRLRQTYSSLLLNGPFSFIIANRNEMIGITDRIRLRPLVAATSGDFVYFSSEEASIREICKEPDRIWMPRGGEAIVARLYEPKGNFYDGLPASGNGVSKAGIAPVGAEV